jgi:hypothetical protein
MEDTIVDNPDDQHDPLPFADHLYSQRETIRECLDSLAADVGVALRDAGLTCPVFLTVPNSGDSTID